MSSKDSFNLFDSSMHKSKKKAEHKGSAPPKPQLSLTAEQKEQRRIRLFEDPQVKDAIQKMEKLNNEIKLKFKELVELGGFTPRSIKLYLQNPKNFDPTQWQQIQEHQEELEKTLGNAIDPKFKQLRKEKHSSQVSKERKGKTLGGRKNWLDMH